MKRLSRQILEQILAHSSDGIVIADARDPDFPVVYANSAYERRSGYGADELLGGRLPLLSHGSLGRRDVAHLKEALDRGESYEGTLVDSHKDGTSWVSQVRVEPLYDPRGVVSFFLLSQNPRSGENGASSGVEVGMLQQEIQRARQELGRLDRREPVTGVLRYEYFLELAEKDFRMARRDERLVAVILLDVVDLDTYRQTFGAKAADSALRMIAGQIHGALRRSGDLCARADEHSIVALTHGKRIDEIRELAMRLADNVCDLGMHNPRGRHGRYISAQVGVAGGVPDGDYTPEVAIAQAREDLVSGQPQAAGVRSSSGTCSSFGRGLTSTSTPNAG